MIPRHRQLAALAAGVALLAAAGCGSDDEETAPGIPRASAQQLRRELDLVQDRLDVTRRDGPIGSCNDIDAKSYRDIRALIEGLPDDTDPEVRRALEQSIERLKELTDAECEQLATEIRDRREATTPEPTPQPPPIQTETTPEQTDTQETVPDEKKPKKPKKPKDNGNGDDGGDDPQPGGTEVPGTGGGGQIAPPAEGD